MIINHEWAVSMAGKKHTLMCPLVGTARARALSLPLTAAAPLQELDFHGEKPGTANVSERVRRAAVLWDHSETQISKPSVKPVVRYCHLVSMITTQPKQHHLSVVKM